MLLTEIYYNAERYISTMAHHGYQACFSAVTASHWGSVQQWACGRVAVITGHVGSLLSMLPNRQIESGPFFST